jgi:Holliday junction resolvase RusA-like endonuclease
MRISIQTKNCDQAKAFLFEDLADSEIVIRLEFDKIISVQSRNEKKKELCNAIQNELSKFKWMAVGSVNVEFIWYLRGTERQETDKVGDIDNITKPIIDSLTGFNGILIDDSQIKSLYTYWLSRNEMISDNFLYINIKFINDQCLDKQHLIFIQYSNATCMPFNVDFGNPHTILASMYIIKNRLNLRKAAKKFQILGSNVDRFFVVSEWDIHRTRLNGFDQSVIYSLNQFRKKCHQSGFTWLTLLHTVRYLKKINKNNDLV